MEEAIASVMASIAHQAKKNSMSILGEVSDSFVLGYSNSAHIHMLEDLKLSKKQIKILIDIAVNNYQE